MNSNSQVKQNPGCFGSLLKLLGIKPTHSQSAGVTTEYLPADPDPDPLPYRLRDDFLSPAEASFFHVIKSILGNSNAICCKVSLADIFFVVRPNENKSAFNRINRKHVDFLICDPRTMHPLFAVELDDSSHNRPDRIERDAFVDSVFEAAELPLLHIPVRSGYNTAELGVLFQNALQQRNTGSEALPSETAILHAETQETKIPFCPKCGTPMVLRTAKTGDQAGRQFYGCTNYPKCRMVVPVE